MRFFSKWLNKHHTLVVTALLVAIFLGLFSFVLESIYESNSSVVNFDLRIAAHIADVRDVILNTFFLNLTKLGDVTYLIVAFVAALLLFLLTKKYNQLIIIFSTVAGTAVITFVIKNVVQRARPLDGLITEHGFSFPSAHAFIAVSFWGVLFYLLATLVKNKLMKAALITIGIVLAILIGFSRVYIGVHWASDVVASYLLAIVYIMAVIWIVENKSKIFEAFKVLGD